MEEYKNLGGNSGVRFYKIGDDYIIVWFRDGGVYLYNYVKTGVLYIENMKKLAKQGRGLNSYIHKKVKKNTHSN